MPKSLPESSRQIGREQLLPPEVITLNTRYLAAVRKLRANGQTRFTGPDAQRITVFFRTKDLVVKILDTFNDTATIPPQMVHEFTKAVESCERAVGLTTPASSDAVRETQSAISSQAQKV
ncbi:hypothetical protein HZC21_02820 [Candidatus Peregrinibacteria bacterium]|nr:hypothetical protein [Candidatus Peregrinibacteria bacterium]